MTVISADPREVERCWYTGAQGLYAIVSLLHGALSATPKKVTRARKRST